MRVSREEAAASRERILAAASQLFREKGLDGIGVADLMHHAGLTHGGFYGHFRGKDELAALACARAFEQSAARWQQRIDAAPDRGAALASIVENYLSTRNRDGAGTGCPLSALATDVAREPAPKPIRRAFLDGLDRLVDLLAGLEETGSDARDRALALAQLSTMVGALVLARATRGARVSGELLEAARGRHGPVVTGQRKRHRKPAR